MTRIGKIAIVTAALMGFGAALSEAHAFGGPDHHRGGYDDCHGAMMGAADEAKIDKQLTTDDVRAIITGHLIERGNKRLKVGEVVEQDKDKIIADVVTVDNSLVHKVEVDRHSGRMHPVL